MGGTGSPFVHRRAIQGAGYIFLPQALAPCMALRKFKEAGSGRHYPGWGDACVRRKEKKSAGCAVCLLHHEVILSHADPGGWVSYRHNIPRSRVEQMYIHTYVQHKYMYSSTCVPSGQVHGSHRVGALPA